MDPGVVDQPSDLLVVVGVLVAEEVSQVQEQLPAYCTSFSGTLGGNGSRCARGACGMWAAGGRSCVCASV